MSLEKVIEDIVRRVIREELANREKPALVTMDEFARARGISVSTVRTAIREKRLECERIGRAVRIPRDAVIVPKAKAQEPATQAKRALALLNGGVK